jgi:hypothetical protein
VDTLVFGVVTAYGVGVRVLVLAATRFVLERRAISGVRFDHAEARSILDRMKRDPVTIGPGTDEPTPTPIPARHSEPAWTEPASDCANIVLLWGLDPKQVAGLQDWIQRRLGWEDFQVISIAPSAVGKWAPAATVRDVMIAVNARRPPSGDFKELVKHAVARADPPRVRVLAIAGGREDRTIWADELRSIGSDFVDPEVMEFTP